MFSYIGIFLKGMAMGAANVIPGVSGGTIAFITGIYERLINAIKAMNPAALKLILQGRFHDFVRQTDLWFLAALLGGVAASIISFAKLLEFLFIAYPVLIWSFFFGLIIASVYFISKQIRVWNAGTMLIGLVFAIGAVLISLLTPAMENENVFYLFICGVVAICSMILPGISGSFILILMGNYLLILRAIPEMRWEILLPFGAGCAIGLPAFSYVLSWLFNEYRAHTIAGMTGFIMGSLATIWPWKTPRFLLDAAGELILSSKGKPRIIGYDWQLPEALGGSFIQNFQGETVFALFLIIAGVFVIWLMERFSKPLPEGKG